MCLASNLRQLTYLRITIQMITRTTSSPKCCVQMCLRSAVYCTQLNTSLVSSLSVFYCCLSTALWVPLSYVHPPLSRGTFDTASGKEMKNPWKLLRSLKNLWKPLGNSWNQSSFFEVLALGSEFVEIKCSKRRKVFKYLLVRHFHHHIDSAFQLVLAIGEVDDKK